MFKSVLVIVCLVGLAFGSPIDLVNSAQHLGNGDAHVVSDKQAEPKHIQDMAKITSDLEALTQMFAGPEDSALNPSDIASRIAQNLDSYEQKDYSERYHKDDDDRGSRHHHKSHGSRHGDDDGGRYGDEGNKDDDYKHGGHDDNTGGHSENKPEDNQGEGHGKGGKDGDSDDESMMRMIKSLLNNVAGGFEGDRTNSANLPMMRTTSGNPYSPWWINGLSPYSWWSTMYGPNYYTYPWPTSYGALPYGGYFGGYGGLYANYASYASYPHLGSFDYDDISSASPYYGYPFTNAGYYPAGYSIPYGAPYFGGAYYGGYPYAYGAYPYSWGYPGGFGAAYATPGFGVASAGLPDAVVPPV